MGETDRYRKLGEEGRVGEEKGWVSKGVGDRTKKKPFPISWSVSSLCGIVEAMPLRELVSGENDRKNVFFFTWFWFLVGEEAG